MPRPGVGIGLVGRRAERSVLLAALERARAGRAGGVLVSGDAGVGKSRLVAELTAAAGDALVLVGRCLDTAGAELPYLPFTEIVGQLGPEPVAAHPGLRRLTPDGSDTERGGRELGQLQVFEALLSALGTLDRPVVAVVEDLHWADRSSRDLLVFLLSRLAEQRLLVVATYRADDLHRRHPLRPVLAELVRLPTIERLDLAPLPPSDAFALVSSLAADLGLGEAELRGLAERSEGNAFFAEELVSAAGGGGLPEGLADVLLTRFERLPAPARQVLRVAAVAGRSVAEDTLAEVSDLDPGAFTDAVREAVAHQVLVADTHGELAFRHALLREAVYADLLPGERGRLHARYADLITARMARPGGRDTRLGPSPAAALAHHALAAHDLPRALAAGVQAARDADRLGAPAEVLRHAERAVELWPAVPDAEAVAGVDELTVTLWAAWSASATGDPERGLALSGRALELADGLDDPERAADVRVRHAIRLLERMDGGTGAIAAAREAIALLEGRPPGAELAWAHAILARALWRTDEVAGLREHGEEALRVARAAREALRGSAGVGAAVVGVVGVAGVWESGAGRADVALTEALQDVAAVEADALISLAVLEEFEGRPTRSRELLTEALPQARGSGNTGVELRIFYNRGMSFLEEGSLAEAAAEFAAGGARATETGTTWSAYGMDMRVAQLVSEFMAGQWAAAERTARLGGARVGPAIAGRLAAAGLLVAVGRGRLAEAEARWHALDSRDQQDDQVVLLLGQAGAEAARLRGDTAEAIRRVETALADLDRLVPHHLASISLAALGIAALPVGGAAGPAETLLGTAEAAAAHGTPRSGVVGVEGRAWLARARAEAARVRGEDDPAVWSEVVEAFGYGEVYRQAEALLRRAEAALRLAGGQVDRGRTDRARVDRAAAGRLREEAAADLAAALEIADRIGAEPLAAAVRAAAERAGAAVATARAPSAGVSAAEAATGGASGAGPLTPREHAVLKLVAEGRTNRQVGEALYISEKTVSVHLSRVMAKLGASSRTEAVAIGYERGVIPPRATVQ
ncbi:LuxR family transcriptional regulator [Pseudonocardia sp. WMMC193]|uniref:helix-turn-helix transcriptional regulator n=1 Tax=Pseudonocardia sp. WMMC193 TaxID=2911965 RepID=UPI001F3A13F9|nr:LuxR family transcriptional regulator [Pseudonocardia sp. WMMC193]MCF7553063.1 AAA family ATPase [Pseudonocardia sp. WMMC193]